ncbi:MAG: hypothetical protein PHU27_05555, partial [Salinivirgaceae bacterium]|nr:hypothetical protein [Salinivirgaceae bacterium]
LPPNSYHRQLSRASLRFCRVFGFLVQRMLSFIFLIFIVSYVAIRAYNRSVSSLHRFWVMGAFIGLATYYSHSLVNNFLDVDKIALPFWSFIAIIVYVDNQSRSEVVTKETPLPIE